MCLDPGEPASGSRLAPSGGAARSQLLETVMTGANASERVLGQQLFEFYTANPAESKIHDDAMRSFSAGHAAAIVAAIDLREAHLVVDVGGGTAETLAAIWWLIPIFAAFSSSSQRRPSCGRCARRTSCCRSVHC